MGESQSSDKRAAGVYPRRTKRPGSTGTSNTAGIKPAARLRPLSYAEAVAFPFLPTAGRRGAASPKEIGVKPRSRLLFWILPGFGHLGGYSRVRMLAFTHAK